VGSLVGDQNTSTHDQGGMDILSYFRYEGSGPIPYNFQIIHTPYMLATSHPTTTSSPLVTMGIYNHQDVRSNKLMLYLLGPPKSYEGL